MLWAHVCFVGSPIVRHAVCAKLLGNAACRPTPFGEGVRDMTQIFNNVGLAQLAAIALVGLIVIAL